MRKREITPDQIMADVVERLLDAREWANATAVEGMTSYTCDMFALAATEIRRLREPFRHADDMDWDQLFKMLPDSGHGKFWKAVMKEMRVALAVSKGGPPT